MLSAEDITDDNISDFVKWNCIHYLSGKKYQDWVQQQSGSNTVSCKVCCAFMAPLAVSDTV